RRQRVRGVEIEGAPVERQLHRPLEKLARRSREELRDVDLLDWPARRWRRGSRAGRARGPVDAKWPVEELGEELVEKASPAAAIVAERIVRRHVRPPGARVWCRESACPCPTRNLRH